MEQSVEFVIRKIANPGALSKIVKSKIVEVSCEGFRAELSVCECTFWDHGAEETFAAKET
jgi:hypothetical protein